MAQLRADQLTSRLERGLDTLYVVTGNAPLLVIEAADAIRATARQQGYSERNVLTVQQGFDWGSLRLAAGNGSLFGDRTLIDLRIHTGKPGREGGAALSAYAADLPPDSLTLITLPALGWKDEKASWFQALTSTGTLVRGDAPNLDALPNWLGQRLARHRLKASPDALRFLAERVEGNLLAAHQEIEKLALLLPPGPVSLDNLREAVLDVARYDVFDLAEPLLAGDLARYCRMVDGLRGEGAALPLISWTLADALRTLGAVLQALATGQRFDAASRGLRLFGPRQALMQKASRRLGVAACRDGLDRVARIDAIGKGQLGGDAWTELHRLGLALCAARAA